MLAFATFSFADLVNEGLNAAYAGEHKKAINLLLKACESKDASGCYNLGFIYYQGVGVERDYQKAFNLYKKACESKSVKGCYNLGFMHYKGVGVKQDRSRAREIYAKACDLGMKIGCENYKTLSE